LRNSRETKNKLKFLGANHCSTALTWLDTSMV
jgi:hypothetical protein